MTKQAPKHKWRYGCVKRIYKTVLPGKTFTEVSYELVEMYDQGRSWTENAVTVTGSSKARLIEVLMMAIADIKTYPVVIEKKPIVHRIGSIKDNGKKRK